MHEQENLIEPHYSTLRMRPQYIDWTTEHRKFCTTRTKHKGMGEKELISGSYFKPKKSGVIIDIIEIWSWTLLNLANLPSKKEVILSNEDSRREAPFDTWSNFIKLLEEINKSKIGNEQIMYTHFYKVINDGKNI